MMGRPSERLVSGDIPHTGYMIPVEVWRTFRPDDIDGLAPVYVFQWGDNVANEWTEVYVTLGQALARLAVLSDTGTGDGSDGFRHDPMTFGPRWDHFTRKETE